MLEADETLLLERFEFILRNAGSRMISAIKRRASAKFSRMVWTEPDACPTDPPIEPVIRNRSNSSWIC